MSLRPGVGAGAFAGGGEMGDAVRAANWSRTPLGDLATWPQPLRTFVALMLGSAQPMFIAWGAERTWLYNDAFIRILGRKHPSALGQASSQVWSEAWTMLEPLFDQVDGGQSVHMDDLALDLDRQGVLEEAHFAFSYNPAWDENGTVCGLFGVCTETTEQVRSSRAASKADERLQFALSAGGGVGIWEWDITRNRVVADERFALIYGVAPHRAAAGAPIEDFFRHIHPGDIPAVQAAIDESVRTLGEFNSEYRLIQPDGSARWVLVKGRCEPDAAGRPSRFPGVAFDITSRKAAQHKREALATFTDRIQHLEDPDELAYVAAEILGQTLEVSRAGYGVVDIRAETITIERDWNAPGVTTLAGMLRFRDYGSYIENLVRGETVVIGNAETDPRTSENSDALKAISAQAVVNMPVTEEGGLVALLYLNHATARVWPPEDLELIREFAARTRTATERLRVTAALRDTKASLTDLNADLARQVEEKAADRDRLWRTSQDLLAVVGPDGVFQAANPAWLDILGWSEAEVVGKNHLYFNHPENHVASEDALQLAIQQQLPAYENRTLAKDGSYRWISWVAAAEDGLVYASGRHVSAEHDAREELERAQEALRQSQKMEAVGQLTGGLAHDFNNLLTGMMGNLELLQMRLARGRLDDLDRFILAAQGAGRRAASLTQRLLAFSRRQTLDPKPTDVNRLIAGMEDLLRRTVGPSNEIEIVGAGGLWTANIDAAQLENALLNLCINARDAMPGGGRLTIETANKWLDERTARERDLPQGQYLSVCVTDTGTGMTAETIKRAFEPFYTTKPLGQGTGLGLSMIYGFARQSNGQVRIYSELGTGTTVCVYLPRDTSEVVPLDDLETTASVGANAGETILVVDDEVTIRHLIDEVLDEAGYTVIGAADGAAGLKVLQSDARVELLITDVGLPGGMNGRQVADAARSLRPGLKVLFITGYAENAAVGNGHLEAGMELLTKPFTMDALAAKVADMLKAKPS